MCGSAVLSAAVFRGCRRVGATKGVRAGHTRLSFSFGKWESCLQRSAAKYPPGQEEEPVERSGNTEARLVLPPEFITLVRRDKPRLLLASSVSSLFWWQAAAAEPRRS